MARKKRGAPWPMYAVTTLASGCLTSHASILAVVALVLSMDVPYDLCTSTSTSGRSDVGKNCFFTAPMPSTEIGRASCRERVESGVGGEVLQTKPRLV